MREKKVMPAVAVAIMILGAGCTRDLFPGTVPRMERTPYVPEFQREDPYAADTSVLVCGVEYDESYEWKRDSAGMDEPFMVVLFRDGERQLGVSNAKVHFVDSSGLWCDEGVCLSLNGDPVYTKPSSSTTQDVFPPWTSEITKDGWALRKDGRIVLEGEGTVGKFYRDEEYVYCSCCEPFDGENEFYIIRDGKKHIVAGLDDVLDARMVGGSRYVLQRTGTSSFSYTSSDGVLKAASLGNIFEILGGSINSKAAVDLLVRFRSQPTRYADIIMDSSESSTITGTDGFSVVLGGLKEYVTCSSGGSISGRHRGKYFLIDKRVNFFSERCACLDSQGRLYLALTPIEGKPFLWVDGQETPLDLHGYLTGVAVVEPR